jgi:hypothetical protein
MITNRVLQWNFSVGKSMTDSISGNFFPIVGSHPSVHAACLPV